MKKHPRFEHLLDSQHAHISKLQRIVKEAMDEEQLILNRLSNPPSEVLTRGQRISDKVARFGGSWAFILSFITVIVAWIAFNTMAANRDDFDPYPFILLNLVLSCVAALQAPIIMMSQNRLAARDRAQADQDFRTNLKAELEIATLHEKMDHLLHSQWQRMVELQQVQLDLLREISARRPG